MYKNCEDAWLFLDHFPNAHDPDILFPDIKLKGVVGG